MSEWEKAELIEQQKFEEAKLRLRERTIELIIAERTPDEIERIKIVLWSIFPEICELRTLH